MTRLGDPPAADSLDAAERLGADELHALQLERLQWTLRHAYDNVPHYRKAFDAAGNGGVDFSGIIQHVRGLAKK